MANSKLKVDEYKPRMTVFNKVEDFDIVIFAGVLYHLRHPLLALEKIFDILTKFLYIISISVLNFA